jgi:hypothetical protein
MKNANLSKSVIAELGLRESDRNVNAQLAPDARIFQYPNIDNVYIMESDLYGNTMPEGSCFLAFEGRDGLMGKHIAIDTLRNCSEEDIKKIVSDNHDG